MKYFVLISVLLFSFCSFAQVEDLNRPNSQIKQPLPERDYKEPLWKVRTFLDYPDYRFLIATGEGRGDLAASNQRLQFNPANHPELGLYVSRGLFTLGYKTALPFLENPGYSDYDLGTTDVTHLEFNFDWKGFHVGTYFTRFKGYFVDLNATQGFTVEKDGTNTTITSGGESTGTPDIWARPDVKTLNFGINADHVFKIIGKDSLASFMAPENPINQIWDLGFLLGVGYQRSTIEGGDPFVPADRADIFPNIAGLTGIYQHVLFLNIGIRNRFNFGQHWFMDLDVSGGPESLTHYQRFNNQSNSGGLTSGERIYVAGGFGYQSLRHSLSFKARSLYRLMHASNSSNLDSQFSHMGIDYAYRF